jgi:hypothetical protein
MRPSEIGVVMVAAEGRDLEHLAAMAHRDRPEPVLVDRPREQLDDPLGQRVRREVPVGRAPAEHHVAQGTSDDVGGVARGPEGLEQLAGGGRDRPLDGGRGLRQLRPRKRYERQASLCSSER